MTIGTLAARIMADASGIKAGMGMARDELRITRQAFVDSTTDLERHNVALAQVESAYEKGALSAEQYERIVSQLNREFADRAAEEYRTRLKGIGETMTTVGTKVAAVGAGITATFGAIGYSAITSAAEFEQTSVAFETMLGSAEAAQDTLGRLTTFAAATPFQMPEIEQVARGLIMFGETGDGMMDTLKILGDAASGTGASFAEVGQIFNKVRGQGKLMTGEFNQLAERGIISMKDLSNYFGVGTESISKMLETGKVKFSDLRAIMEKLTSDGGRFDDMMLKQSATFAGLSSTLKDGVSLGLRQIGQELLPIGKQVVELGISWTSSFGEMDSLTRKLVAGTVAVGAGLGTLVTVGGAAAVAAGQLTTAYAALNATATGAKVAQLALNTAIGVGYVAAVGAAAVAGYTIGTMLVNQTQWAQDAAKAYKEYADGVTALQTREQQQRQEALKRLQDTAPQDRMSAVQSEMDMAQKNLDGLTARAEMAREEMEKLKPTWLSLGQAGKKLWEAQAAEYNELKERAAEAGRWVNTLDEEMKKADADAKAAKRAAGDAAAEEIERQAKQQSKAADEEQQRQQEELKDREQFAEDWKMEDMFTVPGYEESLREMKVYEDALAATGEEAEATTEDVAKMKRELTSNTMGVVSMGEAFDIARQGAMRTEPVDRFAGIGSAVPTATDPAVLDLWKVIANGVTALVQKDGVTVEEVSL